MLSMTTVIVDYTLKCVSNFLYFTGRTPPLPNVAVPGVTYPFTLFLEWTACVNNALINALKK